ncbi:phosphatidylinositol-specific phospholipase C [Niabella hirudinis]|uniref:phosphatidylinositol-specific phospholipase C n=1 Tax=Niabella hirudinis TaxID=1285929 RepID=UPI003EB76317
MSQPSLPKWISYLNGAKKLLELTIPGTHDSGTYPIDLGPAKCQNLSLTEQLNAGIRFLDIRLKPSGHDDDPDALMVWHGQSATGLNFNDDVVGNCNAFLQAYPQETIIMSIKNESATYPRSDVFYKKLNEVIAGWGMLFYTGTTLPLLSQARGRIILIRRFTPDNNPDIGINLYNDWPNGEKIHHWTNGNGVALYVQDEYTYFTIIENKFNDYVKPTLEAAAGTQYENYLFLNFASCTGRLWPDDIAEIVNAQLYPYINGHNNNRYGIIPMDFPETETALISALVQCNYHDPLALSVVRNTSNGAVYLNFDSQLHHVPNPAIADHLFGNGWDFQGIPNLDFVMDPAAEGAPLLNGRILAFSGKPELYLCYEVAGDPKPVLRHIANPATANAYGLYGTVDQVPEATKDNYDILTAIIWS